MTEMQHQIIVQPEQAKQRIDQLLSDQLPQYSRSKIKQWVLDGSIRLNQQITQNKKKVQAGDIIDIAIVESPTDDSIRPQAIPLNIVYEDESLIIINKAAGMVVHPGAGNPDGTLVNALCHHEPSLARLPRAGIIHRLDKDTSGLLIATKSLEAHTQMVAAMQQRQIVRRYQTIVNGVMVAGGTVETNIERHPRQRTKMAVSDQGKLAVTHYAIMQKYRAHTHLDVTLDTGRTHQIRVHMQHLGYPVVGDATYGARPHLPRQCLPTLKAELCHFKRQALHAYYLRLQHPVSHEACEWEIPLPEDIQTLCQLLQEDIDAHA